jgi:hypothetical protein
MRKPPRVLDHVMAPIVYHLIFGSGVKPSLAAHLTVGLFVTAGVRNTRH